MSPLGPAIPDLSVRSRRAELMDDPGLDAYRHAEALRALARINRVSLSARRLWRQVHELHERGVVPVRVLDLACGGGDVLRWVADRARGAGAAVVLHGCDVSPRALERARSEVEVGRSVAGGATPGLRFYELDALSDPIPAGYDLITSTLFLHHLCRPDAVDLLRRMAAAARHRVFVQDLRRTRLGYLLAWIGLHTLTRSDVARTDGLRSVESAFRVEEARALCAEAGLHAARVETGWPQRFTIRWDRTEAA